MNLDVDIVDDDDWETLASVRDGQINFIIASHMLEVTENPIGTIRSHHHNCRPGGMLCFICFIFYI